MDTRKNKNKGEFAMSASKVYFTNLRAKSGDNLLQKLERLID